MVDHLRRKTLANSFLSSFCMNLAMILQAGITLSDGILMLQDDEPDKAGRAVLQSLLDVLDAGAPLSQAFKESGYFPRYMSNMTEIGEKAGRLVETLKALSEHYDRQDQLSASLRNAVMYPVILLVMMVVVVFILIIQVLPIFNDVFNRLGAQMSPLATSLMRFGGWISGASAVIAVVVGAILLIALAAWIVPSIRGGISRLFGSLFGNRGLMANIASSRFVSAMALATASGLDTIEAVDMAASVSGGVKAVNEKHKKCVELLNSGSTLAEAMYKAGIISTRNSRMLSLGGRSGMTETAMADIAARSDRGVRDEIDRLIGKIEPTIVIITSVIVGVILFSVMLPLMGIMTSIG